MATTVAPPQEAPAAPIHIDTQHEDLVHDAQMDYYGSKLATCSSDRTIKIYNVSDSSYELSATLQGHQGPVWQVSWAHPKFGVLLASASFDGSVLIHAEVRPREWTVLHKAEHLHESSVNGIAFGPHESGLWLATAGADGRVAVLRHLPNQTWEVSYLDDCSMGVNAVSWAPYGAYQATATDDAPDAANNDADAPRLVTAGCDHQIRFWKHHSTTNEWLQETSIIDEAATTHSDWVRDVAWAPTLLPNTNIVASASEDQTVLIWKQTSDQSAAAKWTSTVLQLDAPVWRVSWSVTGHLLAVSSGDSDVTLFKESLDGQWTQVGSVEDEPAPAEPQHS